MTEKTEKTLVDEIIENARNDRKRLEAVADGLTRGFDRTGDIAEDENQALDPEVSAAFAEEIAKVSDSLTRVNQQLVELVKIDAKKSAVDPNNKPVTKGNPISKKDAEDIYDELSSPVDQKDRELN